MADIYGDAASQRNVDPLFLQAIARVESGERDDAVGKPTRYGTAKGRMQFIDETGKRYGVTNPHDPKQAVPAAAAYVDDLLKKHGDVNKVLLAYSGGEAAYPAKVAREYAKLAQAPTKAEDDPFAATLSAPVAKAASQDGADPFAATLTAPHTPIGEVDAPKTSMSGVGNSVIRGLHDATDAPATALAKGADWIARQFGLDTNFGADAANAGADFKAAYDADPNNKGFVPGAARLAGNALVTIPAAIGPGKLVEGAGAVAGAVAPRLAPFLSAAVPVASGAAQGATVAGMTGEDVGQGAVAGGVVGGVLGAGAGLANRLMRSGNPAVETAVKGYGIPLRAGQTADSPFVRKLDQMVGQLPGSGIEASNATQRTAFNRAVAKTFGEEAESITPAVMQRAKERIGGVMNRVESGHTVKLDKQFTDDLTGVVTKWGDTLTAPEFDVIKRQVAGVLRNVQTGKQISGETYGNLVGHNSPLSTAASSTNPNIARPAQEIVEALKDALQRSLPADARKAYTEARYQYKNMMTIAPMVNKGVPGDISPLLLQGAANRSFKGNAFRGAGDLGELGDIGQQFLRQPRDSGTPLGMAINNTLYGGVMGLAKTAAGVTGGRLVGRALQANPVTGVGITPAEISTALFLRNRLLANTPQGER